MGLSIHEFIESQAQQLSGQDIEPLCSQRLQPITQKMLRSEGRDAEQLLHSVQFLVRIASEFDEFQGVVGISQTRREAAFALQYFLEDNDAIPDDDEEFGLKDDLIIAQAVLEKNEKALRPFADACGYTWSRLTA